MTGWLCTNDKEVELAWIERTINQVEEGYFGRSDMETLLQLELPALKKYLNSWVEYKAVRIFTGLEDDVDREDEEVGYVINMDNVLTNIYYLGRDNWVEFYD